MMLWWGGSRERKAGSTCRWCCCRRVLRWGNELWYLLNKNQFACAQSGAIRFRRCCWVSFEGLNLNNHCRSRSLREKKSRLSSIDRSWSSWSTNFVFVFTTKSSTVYCEFCCFDWGWGINPKNNKNILVFRLFWLIIRLDFYLGDSNFPDTHHHHVLRYYFLLSSVSLHHQTLPLHLLFNFVAFWKKLLNQVDPLPENLLKLNKR